MGSALGMEQNSAEVAFLNLGYFDATRFYWDPWAQKRLSASLLVLTACILLPVAHPHAHL